MNLLKLFVQQRRRSLFVKYFMVLYEQINDKTVMKL